MADMKQLVGLMKTDPVVKKVAMQVSKETKKLLADGTPEDFRYVQQWIASAVGLLAQKLKAGKTSSADLSVVSVNSTPRGNLSKDVGGRLSTQIGGQIGRLVDALAEAAMKIQASARKATAASKFKPGDKVKYSAKFLKSAGMTSDRGRKGVITDDPTGMPAGRGFVSVKWNDETTSQPIQESALMKTSASFKGAVTAMRKYANEKDAANYAKQQGLMYGFSTFSAGWFVGTEKELKKIGVVAPIKASFKGAVPGNLADNTKPSTPESQQYAVDLLKQGGILPEDQQADDYPVLTAAVKREIIATLLRRKQTKLATWASRNLVTAAVSMQQVSQFRREAASAGDMAAVKIADKALNGNKAALREVEKMIRAAEGSTHRVHADTAYMKSLAPAAKTALKSYGKLKGSGLNFVVEMEDGRYMEFDFQAATRFDPKAGWMLTLKQGSSILGWTGADLTGDKDTDTKTIAQKVKVQMTKWH